ncbi:hypothetical protein [Pseudomonas syringae]|uniref:hypothetical protein n=1 Tax=Pseudomonas syringae TaxID=317 RepID=UPI001F344BC7|nr:hypothetical protein [Pseudomonas syringae]MCF5374474.1 hypothetical protein [Pseudomonas syringae]MCF5381959.1 hypothetical protein [Pseudomonas syringae]MCF5419509.1 hypothetical protein [Pseudomonas syringae]MCF5454723.1 hypothetical protein [Pseudomonas syringae]MCF5460639.1 hypothetical protein [Pseudomonas syringae]
MNHRETWLAALSDSELLALNPWDILTSDNARGFLISTARQTLSKFKRFGLSKMDNEDLLHEVYPMLYDALPGIFASSIASSTPEDRDRFIYGCLRRLVRCRLIELVFGSISPCDLIYIEEVSSAAEDSDNPFLPTSNGLMHPFLTEVNSYLESQPNYQPQFLSESQFVPEEHVQMIHRMIEMFRHYLTNREIEVLRNLLLNYQDRSMVALEVGTTPKMVSRYRQSIQKKMKDVLMDLGWSSSELTKLLGKAQASVEATA